jgi:hypothetical protein
MRFFRSSIVIRVIFGLIFLGVLIVMLVTTLLFWDESCGMKNLRFLALAIPLLVFWIALDFHILRREESFYIENKYRRIVFERKASEEWKRINRRREEGFGQIDAGLNRMINSGLIWMRLLHSRKFIGLFFYIITPFVFWCVFDFRLRSSIAPGLLVAFLTEGVVRLTARYRIALLFDKEFPAGSPERAVAIEHLSDNRHAYWFASELLKVVVP